MPANAEVAFLQSKRVDRAVYKAGPVQDVLNIKNRDHPALIRVADHFTDMDDELRKSVDEDLRRKHGNIVRLQSHHAPEWFGDGWLVSFELPKRAGDLMPVVRVAFFRNENGKAALAKEFVMRNADGSYPSWRSLDQDGLASPFDQ